MNLLKRTALLTLLLTFLSAIATADDRPEGALVAFSGQVFVKKPGKRFAESAAANVRLAPGTTVQTGADAACTVLLANDRIVRLGASASYQVGAEGVGEAVNASKATSAGSLWTKYLDRWASSEKTAADSSVLGAIRGANENDKPQDKLLSAADLQAFSASLPESTDWTLLVFGALTCEQWGQLKQAESWWLKAVAMAPSRAEKGEALKFLLDLYTQAACKNLALGVQKELASLASP